MCLVDRFRTGIRVHTSVIPGIVDVNAPYDWSMYEAAHIFPLEKESVDRVGFRKCITDMEGFVGASKMNSCQNGLLLQVCTKDSISTCSR